MLGVWFVCWFGVYPRNFRFERDGICRDEFETQLTLDWNSLFLGNSLPTDRNSNIHLEDVLGTEDLDGNGNQYVQAVQVGKRRQDCKIIQDMAALQDAVCSLIDHTDHRCMKTSPLSLQDWISNIPWSYLTSHVIPCFGTCFSVV